MVFCIFYLLLLFVFFFAGRGVVKVIMNFGCGTSDEEASKFSVYLATHEQQLAAACNTDTQIRGVSQSIITRTNHIN